MLPNLANIVDLPSGFASQLCAQRCAQRCAQLCAQRCVQLSVPLAIYAPQYLGCEEGIQALYLYVIGKSFLTSKN